MRRFIWSALALLFGFATAAPWIWVLVVAPAWYFATGSGALWGPVLASDDAAALLIPYFMFGCCWSVLFGLGTCACLDLADRLDV